jgi:hypothetical protein
MLKIVISLTARLRVFGYSRQIEIKEGSPPCVLELLPFC